VIQFDGFEICSHGASSAHFTVDDRVDEVDVISECAEAKVEAVIVRSDKRPRRPNKHHNSD